MLLEGWDLFGKDDHEWYGGKGEKKNFRYSLQLILCRNYCITHLHVLPIAQMLNTLNWQRKFKSDYTQKMLMQTGIIHCMRQILLKMTPDQRYLEGIPKSKMTNRSQVTGN